MRFLTLALMTLSSGIGVAQATVCSSITCSLTGPIFEIASCTGNDHPTTNDEADIQEAFCCVKDGGTVLFPPGATCTHRREIEIIGGANFVIEGNGATLKSVTKTPVENNPYGGIRLQNVENFELRNLTVDGSRDLRDPPAEVINHGLLLRDTYNGFLLNVKSINHVVDGFALKGRLTRSGETQSLEDNRLKLVGCSAENNARHGLSLVDVSDVQIIGGAYNGNAGLVNGNAVPFADGIRIETHNNGNGERISNVLISGVTLADNAGSGIHVQEDVNTSTEDIRIVDNFIHHNDRHALRLRGRRIDVRGNQIYDQPEGYAAENREAAIVIQNRSQNLRFSENRVEKVDGMLMSVEGLHIAIEDNIFRDITFTDAITGEASFLVEENGNDPTEDVIFSGNLFEDFETGVDVVTFDASVVRPAAVGNYFRNINLTETLLSSGASKPSLIRTEALESRLVQNEAWRSENRGFHLSADADRSLVDGNHFYGMVGNVVWLEGDDSTFTDNRIESALRSLQSSLAEDTLIRFRGLYNTASGNVVACASGDTAQGGLRFEQQALGITDNVVIGCSSSTWLLELGLAAKKNSDNLRHVP